MNLEKLKSIYSTNDVVKSICDHMASRTKNQNETSLDRMLHHLAQEDHNYRKSDVIAAFRCLEEAECGDYVEGRHGWKSRFIWSVKSLLVAGAAQGTEELADIEEEDDSDWDVVQNDMIEHSFWLRPNLAISIELPADLSENEAERLSRFVSALSFEDHF